MTYGTDPEWLYRRDDPATSQMAAYLVDTEHYERFVHVRIYQAGIVGLIMDDLVQRYKGVIPYSTLTARRRALLDKRLIVAGPDKRLTVANAWAEVCRAIEFATDEQKLFNWGNVRPWPWSAGRADQTHPVARLDATGG
jgi:hypothetical protein